MKLTEQSVAPISWSTCFGKGVNSRTASHFEEVCVESVQQFKHLFFAFLISTSKQKKHMEKNLNPNPRSTKTNPETGLCYFKKKERSEPGWTWKRGMATQTALENVTDKQVSACKSRPQVQEAEKREAFWTNVAKSPSLWIFVGRQKTDQSKKVPNVKGRTKLRDQKERERFKTSWSLVCSAS